MTPATLFRLARYLTVSVRNPESPPLQFGDFTLKSGRKSPYFVNLGRLNAGAELAFLGEVLADRIHELFIKEGQPKFDVIFGPAYKAIPLSAATAIAMASKYGYSINTATARKETKEHGEGGSVVGPDLTGQRVLILDDVLTAGTSIRASAELIKKVGGTPVAAIVLLDRMETSGNHTPMSSLLTSFLNIPVAALATIQDIVYTMDPEGSDSKFDHVRQHLLKQQEEIIGDNRENPHTGEVPPHTN